MPQQRSFLSSLRKELGLTVLALFVMLLQLIFSAAHLTAQEHGSGQLDRPGQLLIFWEICTGQGVVSLPAAKDGSLPFETSLDQEDCAICATASISGFVAPDTDFSLAQLPLAVGALRWPQVSNQRSFQTYPRAGDSRAPPSAAIERPNTQSAT